MLSVLLAALLAAQAAPPSPPPAVPEANATVTLEALPLEHAAAARCAVAFATVSRWQKAGDARGSDYPDIEAAATKMVAAISSCAMWRDADLASVDGIFVRYMAREGVIQIGPAAQDQ